MEPVEGLATIAQRESAPDKSEFIGQSQEAKKNTEQNMTSREEASLKLRDAGDIIRRYKEEGFFGNEGEDKYTKAQTALLYKGTGGSSTKEASLQLQAMIDSVREIADKNPQAQELNSFFSGNIKVFNQTDGQIYSLNDWEEKLNTIQDDASLSEEDRVHKIEELKKEVFYGFLLQKEEVKTQEQQKSAEDIIIAKRRKSFEEQFKLAEKRGDVPKEQMEQIEQTLVMLRLAEEANGDAGVILKHLALENLREEHGAQGLDNAIDTLSKQVPGAIGKICDAMSPEMAGEFRNAIKEGKLADLIQSGKLLKIEGMRELLFGKEMTEKMLKEILRIDKKKKWKDPLLLALIMLLIGPMEMGKELAPLSK